MLSKPNILVFTDFNLASDLALQSAETIRKKVGGQIHIEHISDLPIQWDWIAQEASAILQSEELYTTLVTNLNKVLSDQIKRCEVQATSNISLGPVYEGILGTIKKNKPDLVIMGHKGSAHGKFNLGGVVAKVVASSSVPILVIKKPLSAPLGIVTGLVDPKDIMQPIISATEEFSSLLSARPEVISVWKNMSSEFFKLTPVEKNRPLMTFNQDEVEVILHRMREEISKVLDPHSNCKIRVEMTVEKHLAYHLVKILDEDKVDLVVMKRHQKGILDKILIGSETRRMLEIYSGNILVLPP